MPIALRGLLVYGRLELSSGRLGCGLNKAHAVTSWSRSVRHLHKDLLRPKSMKRPIYLTSLFLEEESCKEPGTPPVPVDRNCVDICLLLGRVPGRADSPTAGNTVRATVQTLLYREQRKARRRFPGFARLSF
jgi:hypothetical protein